jgi:hypothetical protein
MLINGDTTMLAGYIPTCATETNDVTDAVDNVAGSWLTALLRATGIPASTVWNWPAIPASPPTGSRLDNEDTNEDRRFPNPVPNPAKPAGAALNDGNVAATDIAPA